MMWSLRHIIPRLFRCPMGRNEDVKLAPLSKKIRVNHTVAYHTSLEVGALCRLQCLKKQEVKTQ